MTPEQTATISAIAAILTEIGTWPIGTIIIAVIFGPWVITFFVNRSIEKRHEAAVKMYKDNVKLVENYETICPGAGRYNQARHGRDDGTDDVLKNQNPVPSIDQSRNQQSKGLTDEPAK